MRGLIFYTTSRLALFLVVWLVLQLVGLRGLTAAVVALLISGAIAFFVLNRQRDSAAASVSSLFRRVDERIERSRAAEDGPVDAAAQGRGGSEGDGDDQSGPNASPQPRSTP